MKLQQFHEAQDRFAGPMYGDFTPEMIRYFYDHWGLEINPPNFKVDKEINSLERVPDCWAATLKDGELIVVNTELKQPVRELKICEGMPFKLGQTVGIRFMLSGSDGSLISKLPTNTNEAIIINTVAVEDLKGISRAVKKLSYLSLSKCSSKLKGMLELAMLDYNSTKGTMIGYSDDVAPSVQEACKMIRRHKIAHGKSDLLGLRKQLIEAGLGDHA